MIEEEKKLVKLAKKDLRAFSELYNLYVKKIYSFVVYMTGNHTEAEDIVSETFEKAMLNIDKFEYRGYSFGAWLFKIAKNLVYDKSKGKKNLSLEDIQEIIRDDTYKPEDIAEKRETSDQIHKLLFKLKDEQREVMILRYIEEYSIREVCQITGRSEDSVKSLAKRALSNLKQLNKTNKNG